MIVRANRPIIVSFSGIDGAGKTTQIDALCNFLREAGIPFRLHTFWDDVAALTSFRERMSRKVFKGDDGVGSPENPIQRRDKNVQSWYATSFRYVLYALDALKLRTFVRRLSKRHAAFVIFDRYLYDELANLPLGSKLARAYIRMLFQFAPQPDVALLLDADPLSATSRKPEYPLQFVRSNRDAYLDLSRLAKMTVVAPGTIEATSNAIRKLVHSKVLQPLPSKARAAAEVQCFEHKATSSQA